MKTVAFYLGTHGTEPDRVVRTLMQNRDWMLANGTEPVPPSRHRGIFEEALGSLKGAPATPEMEEVILDAILDLDAPGRIICSQPALLGVPARCLAPPGFYMAAGQKMLAAANLFPSYQTEFFLALRNPATLVPHLAGLIAPRTLDQVAGGQPPESMRWAPAVRQMLQALNGRRLVLWCHEDTPLIWPEVMRRLAGMPASVPLKGGLAVLAEILTEAGLAELREQLAAGSLTIAARRDLFSAALVNHARPEAIETVIDLPGWTQAQIDRMTHDYDEDVAEIAALSGVEFITP